MYTNLEKQNPISKSNSIQKTSEQNNRIQQSGAGYDGALKYDNINIAPVQFNSKNDTGLPDALKTGVENLSGYSMDDVKVHYNSDKPSKVQAYAYTQGSDIHVAPGQEKHLAHEAWHVVQQKEGRVKPTLQLKGLDVNDSPELEREADVMGERALNGEHPDDAGLLEQDAIDSSIMQRAHIKKGSIRTVGNKNITNEDKERIEAKSTKPEETYAHSPLVAFETFGNDSETLSKLVKNTTCEPEGENIKLYSMHVIGINKKVEIVTMDQPHIDQLLGITRDVDSGGKQVDKLKAKAKSYINGLSHIEQKEKDNIIQNFNEEMSNVRSGLSDDEIIKQVFQIINRKYSGETENRNTLLIEMDGASSSELPQKKAGNKADSLSDKISLKAGQFAYILPFIWWATEEEGGYDLPYFEVRKELMDIASEKTKLIQDNIIFRWIDRDVTDDGTIKSISNSQDSFSGKLVTPEKNVDVATGAYAWTVNEDIGAHLFGDGTYKDEETKQAKKTTYKAFLKEFNKKEQELRAYYFELLNQYGHIINTNKMKFYLPEPVLYMNRKMHDKARGNLEGKINVIGDNGQQRESEAAVGTLKLSPKELRQIYFIKNQSVGKPVKSTGTKYSYLSELEKGLLSTRSGHRRSIEGEAPSDITKFCEKLTNTRQSAFRQENWKFLNEDGSLWYKGGMRTDDAEKRGIVNQWDQINRNIRVEVSNLSKTEQESELNFKERKNSFGIRMLNSEIKSQIFTPHEGMNISDLKEILTWNVQYQFDVKRYDLAKQLYDIIHKL